MTEADKLRDYIAQKQGQIDRLLATYGQGVRPSWVSEELSILYHYQDDAIQTLKQLEANNATDHSSN
ncbi:hypothetical protein UFOVP845_53 [uncultured Caudovirales phage]|uniref:Uncharacterized protein n=1 Tax=uncultured Caudovirales phage TaxID=2100421 RepID=A0A6J5P6S6_9CAUD|nr:hypothetical protein UFOVP845_53 [uncultured Caudovirales phage]